MDWVTYVPEYNDNRTKPEGEQITVEILPLTVRESKKLSSSVTAKRVKGGGFKTNQSEITLSMFHNHVRNIRNLVWNGEPAVTAEDLMDTAYVDLAGEIEEAISDASILSEGDVKNLRSQSNGRNATDGTASPAQ